MVRRDENASDSAAAGTTHNVVGDPTRREVRAMPPLSLHADLTPSESLLISSTPDSVCEITKRDKQPQTLSVTGLPFIKNKNNHGRLFVNGLPFWVQRKNREVTFSLITSSCFLLISCHDFRCLGCDGR
ncbi:hypothetical protein KIN20_020717 [Parelaphostrongylus tenuis]|uniref:Uncharacterized protein n=1 Tax=Parelaphostrongylus tenuis TaxID=148309 RepID=A0AAD5MN06_PARTN|nr:hypothetical protein KIN20_020717 [Parelaphostrongylus tenuis]